jgi:hypothetical protein
MKFGKYAFGWGVLALIFFACSLGVTQLLWAQQADPAQTPTTTDTPTPAKQTTDPGISSDKPAPIAPPLQNDRLFFALPNLLTVENASSLPPLTTKQKIKAEALQTFDPVEIVFVGIQAGIGQADNTNPTYGQGFVGYSKRFGTAYADTIIASFNTGAIWPSILHQDPRYYQMGHGNPFHRMTYSAMRVVISRSDNGGKSQFNYSEFIGNGIASGLSNAYHPGPHTIVSTANVMETQVLVDVLSNELKEFWPDLRRGLVHLKHRN